MGPGADQIANGNGAQVIVTSYQFHCCGEITVWQTHVLPGGGNHNEGVYSINFQVWRPSLTVGSDGAGEYSLVGENRFTSIFLRSNRLVSETPEPSSMISVKPGDVVGFFQSAGPDERGNDPDSDYGIQLQPGYSNARMLFYQTSASNASPSLLMAGPPISSTNAGPMLSVNICEFLVVAMG